MAPGVWPAGSWPTGTTCYVSHLPPNLPTCLPHPAAPSCQLGPSLTVTLASSGPAWVSLSPSEQGTQRSQAAWAEEVGWAGREQGPRETRWALLLC